jgi:hypothetical protein
MKDPWSLIDLFQKTEIDKKIKERYDANRQPSPPLDELVRGYLMWIGRYVEEGHRAFLLSFKFKPLSSKVQMNHEIERVYSTFVTRAKRRPRSVQKQFLPILITIPDFPVWRRDHRQQRPNKFLINDGLHMHGVLLMPPSCSRLKEGIILHFKENEHLLYAKDWLLELHVKLIDRDLCRAIDYIFKSLKNRKVGLDDILIFPR